LPTTSLTALTYLLPFVDRVVLQTADPFVVPAEPLSSAPERAKILRENLIYHEYRCEIVAAGGMDTQHAARMNAHGAGTIVLDDALFFDGTRALSTESVEQYKSAVLVGKKLV
jgi:pentose-5-phosphate-3-epimerase